MYEYQIKPHEEAGTFWSSCPDIPEAHSAGETLAELRDKAVEGIVLALSIYVDRGRAIPTASQSKEGLLTISLPAQVVAKIVLWNLMCEKGLRVADLARAMEISHPVASRLVDFEHNSKIEQVEAALKKLESGITVKPIDPSAVRIEFYPTFNNDGHRTILVKREDVPFADLPESLVEVYKNVPHQDDLINLNDLPSRWWLTPEDATALQTKGWTAFSFGLPIKS